MGNCSKRRLYRLGAFSAVCAAAATLLTSGAEAAPGACREDTLHLRGDWGSARFTVEIADDAQEQAQGLMFRETLAQSAGMLFVYPTSRPVSFWMRNTLIPLDMLFIDAQGVVQRIHADAVPLDETPIDGGSDVVAVLEINGGLAHRMGIAVGSEVRHPALPADQVRWSCQID